MMLTYKEQAQVAYSNDPEKLRNKAIAAGKYMDGRLKTGYFDSVIWLKYFDYFVIGSVRCKMILDEWKERLNNESAESIDSNNNKNEKE